MKILLIQLPPWDIETLPLGLAYIAGALSNKNYEVKIFDMNIRIYDEMELKERNVWKKQDQLFWEKELLEKYSNLIDKFVEEITSENYDLIGISANIYSVNILNYVLKSLKQKTNSKIVVDGGLAFEKNSRLRIFDELIDFFIVDEGEVSIQYLLNKLESNTPVIENNEFEVWKDKKRDYLILKSKSKLKPLQIPDPIYELFPIDLYEDKHTLPIMFSRGCIRKCAFCSDSPQQFPYRVRNPKNVVKEMKKHIELFKRNVFRTVDLVMNGNIKFLEELSDLIIENKIKCNWNGQGIIREEMTPELLMKIRFSGCMSISYGVESFSDAVLNSMRKGYTSKTAQKVINDTKESGISVSINLIVGFPGETRENVYETIRVLESLSSHIDLINSLNLCTINKGSSLHFEPKLFNISSKEQMLGGNWSTKNKLDLKERIKRFKILYEACLKLNLKPKWTNYESVK
ncbi:B12-binding domain-containing radical SAM protein [archaeon]|nr:B12-binding domain-containing radical SAM protein [archaeon]